MVEAAAADLVPTRSRAIIAARSRSSVADLDDEDEELPVTDLVGDAEVSGPHPPLPCTAHQLPRLQGTRFRGRQVDGRLDPSAPRRVQLA